MKISEQNKTFFMGNTLFGKQDGSIQDKVALRKQLYQKEAMRVVTSANKGEQRIDENVADLKERVKNLQKDMKNEQESLKEIHAQMEQAKDEFGVKDDSQEQKDLELLQKAYEAGKPGSGVELTKEEEEQLLHMGELTDYQKMSMDLYKSADNHKENIAKYQREMQANISVVRTIAIERLKSQGMLEAQKVKEELLEAASKDAMGMLVDDAKAQVDEKAEEVQEEAKEREEKAKEQEERIEAAKDRKAAMEELVENSKENIENLTEQAVESEDITRDIDGEVQKILDELKLLEEDLKGLEINTGI